LIIVVIVSIVIVLGVLVIIVVSVVIIVVGVIIIIIKPSILHLPIISSVENLSYSPKMIEFFTFLVRQFRRFLEERPMKLPKEMSKLGRTSSLRCSKRSEMYRVEFNSNSSSKF